MKSAKTIAVVVLLFSLLMAGLAAGVLFSQKPLDANAAPPTREDNEGSSMVYLPLIRSSQEDEDADEDDDEDDDDEEDDDDQSACAPEKGKTVSIATAKLIIEYNATDEDLGVHGAFDDDGWSKLCVYDPSGKPVLTVKPQGRLKGLTMAGIFFESREPPLDEFSFEDLKAKFPEGQYQVRAISFDGKALAGAATFTHDVPAPPTITSPAITDEEHAEDVVVSPTGLVVTWEDVTETVDGDPVEITGYEVIITQVEHDDPHGFSQPIFDVHVPPDRNSLSVPAEFLEPGTVYELELLALEESGNQTITVGFFTTDET
jgi:hypothetical protein